MAFRFDDQRWRRRIQAYGNNLLVLFTEGLCKLQFSLQLTGLAEMRDDACFNFLLELPFNKELASTCNWERDPAKGGLGRRRRRGSDDKDENRKSIS